MSETELTLTVPSALVEGVVDIRVVNDDGQPYSQEAALAGGFAYLRSGVVTGVEPRFATLDGGQTLTITGSGFPETLNVFVGGVSSVVRRISDTRLEVTAPPRETPGLVAIRIESAALVATVTVPNAVEYLPRLDIVGIEPNVSSIAGGIAAVVAGSGFRAPADVFFGDTSAVVSGVTATSATTIVAECARRPLSSSRSPSASPID